MESKEACFLTVSTTFKAISGEGNEKKEQASIIFHRRR